jgi:hypothetical protein
MSCCRLDIAGWSFQEPLCGSFNCFMGPNLNGLSSSDSRIEIESCPAENCRYILLGSESRCRVFDSHSRCMNWRVLRVFSGEYGFRTYSESFQGCFSELYALLCRVYHHEEE